MKGIVPVRFQKDRHSSNIIHYIIAVLMRVFNKLCQVNIKDKMYNLTSYGKEERHT